MLNSDSAAHGSTPNASRAASQDDELAAGDAPRPPKRSRTRGSTACAACRNRRSKCDLIDREGCHRCKQLGSECSLARPKGDDDNDDDDGGGDDVPCVAPVTAASDRPVKHTISGSKTTGDERITALSRRLAQLENEVRALRTTAEKGPSPVNRLFDYSISTHATQATHDSERQSAALTNAMDTGTSGASRMPQLRNAGPECEERDETWYRRWADPETFGLVNQGLKGKEESGLRDPIAEGIITEAQAEVAYQLFKYHFAALHPHSTLLLVRSSLPAQPFLLSACLYYVTRCPGPLPIFTPDQLNHVKTYLFQNLNAYHRGCRSSLEGIMAAFVLSHLPPGSADETSQLDASRMIGLAYAQVRELGQSVFLDRLLSSLEAGVPIEHLEQQLSDARMFMSVINRSAWFAHSRCPWASLPVLVEGAQPKIIAHLRKHNLDCDLDRHIRYEQLCLNILFVHSSSWQGLQRNIMPTVQDALSSTDLAKSSVKDLEDLLTDIERDKNLKSAEYLICHVTYCKWWVTDRNLWAINRLPSPLFTSAMYTRWVDALHLAAEASASLLQTCIARSWRLGCLPAAIGKAVVSCYVGLSTGVLYFQHLFPNQPLPSDLDHADLLDAIEKVVKASGSELAMILQGSKDRLAEHKVQMEWMRMMSDVSGQVDGDTPTGQQASTTAATSKAAPWTSDTVGANMGDIFRQGNGDWSADLSGDRMGIGMGMGSGMGMGMSMDNGDFGDVLNGLNEMWSWPMGNDGETAWGALI